MHPVEPGGASSGGEVPTSLPMAALREALQPQLLIYLVLLRQSPAAAPPWLFGPSQPAGPLLEVGGGIFPDSGGEGLAVPGMASVWSAILLFFLARETGELHPAVRSNSGGKSWTQKAAMPISPGTGLGRKQGSSVVP